MRVSTHLVTNWLPLQVTGIPGYLGFFDRDNEGGSDGLTVKSAMMKSTKEQLPKKQTNAYRSQEMSTIIDEQSNARDEEKSRWSFRKD